MVPKFKADSLAGVLLLRKLKIVRHQSKNARWSYFRTLAGSLSRFIAQIIISILVGWLAANWYADVGWGGGYPRVKSHSDWALQTTDFMVNVNIVAAIIIGQLVLFSIRVTRKELPLGFGFWVILALFIALIFLVLRRSETFNVEYDLHLSTPTTFSIAWIFASVMIFPGTDKYKRSKN
jgi:hypothetical protein